jgi:periplasmic protein CpxP/Spy
MKKLITAILSIVLVAMGAMFIFAQDGAATKDGKRGKRGHFGKMKRGGGMMFRGLDLTDEQKTQMKAIRQASKETIKPVREQMKANRQKLQTLSESGTFDEAQVQAIAAQQGTLSAQMIVEKEKVKSQIFNLLTPEQKTKAAEMKAQFKQKRQERMQKRMERRNAKKQNAESSTN